MKLRKIVQLDPNDPEAVAAALKKWRKEHGVLEPRKLYLSPNDEKHVQLWDLCRKFVADNRISCPESVYQCDHVIEHGYEFISEVCKIVGFHEDGGEDG